MFAATASASPATLTLRPAARPGDGVGEVAERQRADGELDRKPPPGVTVSPASGSVPVPANGPGTVPLSVTAGTTDGAYTLTVSLTSAAGSIIPVQVAVVRGQAG